MDEDEPPLSGPDARALRWLRRLVTILTGVMILGMGILVLLFIIRFPAPQAELPVPHNLSLPADATVISVTRGADWWAVALADGSILIYAGGSTVPTRRLQTAD